MSDDYNKSFNDGKFGGGPSPNTNWDAFNAGQTARRNEDIMRQQNDVWMPKPMDTSPIGPTAPSWAGPSFAGPIFTGSATGPWAKGSPMGGCLVLILAGLFSPAVFAVWTCLYPIAAAGVAVAFGATFAGVSRFSPITPPQTRLIMSGVVALVTLWPVSRFDNKWARTRPTYRWIRHGLRLLVVAGYALFALRRAPVSLPLRAVAVVAAVVILHLVLTKTPNLRDFWHGVLANLHLGT